MSPAATNMAASDNISTAANLLSARNLILAAALVLVLSVVGTCLSMLRPNDSGGLGRDSYGVTSDGYRALLETLESLGIRVDRSLAPPRPDVEGWPTLVILRPDPLLVGYSPRYLASLLEWVEHGGRLVVAPADWDHHWANHSSSPSHEVPIEHDILKLLGVDKDVRLEEFVSETDAAGDPAGTSSNSSSGSSGEDDEFWPEDMRKMWSGDGARAVIRPVRCEGSLGSLAKSIRQLAVPELEFTKLVGKPDDLAGSIAVRDTLDDEPLVVAAVARGRGEIVVVSDPRLFANFFLAKADNSVLAAHLLSPHDESVVFDEFYHGLMVRGNPLYLFTRPGYAAMALGILLGVGVWTWRKAVFLGPPLPDTVPARRDIGQYIDAMGDFFVRGPDHRRFLMRETRDGVLQQICQELKLPPDTADPDVIVAALARRSPARADALRRVVKRIDATLASHGNVPKSIYLPTLQRLASCL
jgi:hypothetical protein